MTHDDMSYTHCSRLHLRGTPTFTSFCFSSLLFPSMAKWGCIPPSREVSARAPMAPVPADVWRAPPAWVPGRHEGSVLATPLTPPMAPVPVGPQLARKPSRRRRFLRPSPSAARWKSCYLLLDRSRVHAGGLGHHARATPLELRSIIPPNVAFSNAQWDRIIELLRLAARRKHPAGRSSIHSGSRPARSPCSRASRLAPTVAPHPCFLLAGSTSTLTDDCRATWTSRSRSAARRRHHRSRRS